MSPCHTAPHLCIFLSMAGTLPCPSALFSCNSLSVYICFCFLSRSQPRHHVYGLCLLNRLLLNQKQPLPLFFHIVSTSTPLRMLSSWLRSFYVCAHIFPFRSISSTFSLTSISSSSADLYRVAFSFSAVIYFIFSHVFFHMAIVISFSIYNT